MKKLYVKNLNFETTEEELKATCENYGSVRDVRIIKDRETGRSKGFGFVTFQNGNDAESAIRGLHQSVVGGRTIHAEEAIDKRNAQRPMNS